MLARAVLAIAIPWSLLGAEASEAGRIAGTMPEDYLPQLKPILAHALKRSPELIVKEFDVLTHEARLYGADAPRLPQVGGYFNYGYNSSALSGTNTSQSRGTGFFYNFAANQALFHWGALKNQSDAARLNLLIAEKDTARVYREIAVQLRQAYLALIVEKARLLEARQATQLLQNDVDIIAERKQRGLASGAELAGKQFELRQRRVELERAELRFADNLRRFARLAGIEGGKFSADDVPLEIPRPRYSEPLAAALTAELLRDNAASTLEYEIYDLRLREATLRQKIEAVRLYPKFGATAGYNLRNNTTVEASSVRQEAVVEQSVGIAGYWNVFDGLATRGAKREAAIRKRALQQEQETRIEQLLQSAQSLERTLRLDAEQLEIADIQRGMAEGGRNRTQEEVSLGNMPRLELERARVALLRAEADTLAKRAEFLGHWSEFVGLTAVDPVLTNVSARYARGK